MTSISSIKKNDFSANNILSIAKKAPETKVTRSYTNVVASVTETACFACSALSAGAIVLERNRVIELNVNQVSLALAGALFAPILGSIASQFANPKTVEKEEANPSKKLLNVNRIVTRGAFSVAASSVAGLGMEWDMSNVLIGAMLAGIEIGSLSALFEKYTFKN